MSEPSTKPAKKTKDTAKKAASEKSETKSKDSATASSSSSESSTSDSGGADSGGADSGGAEKGKSARESIGGASDVHYGYFSNVKTPAYRSGWDSIWGGKGANDAPATKKKPGARRKPAPVTLSLELDDLPAEVRNGLTEAARKVLKKQRLSYDRQDKAGAIDWRIECRVRR